MPIKLKDYQDKETTAVQKELADLQRKLFDLRVQGVVEKLEDTSLTKKTRRDIARLKTLLRQRELAAASTANA
jgi:large subunit ribosomal protein L29